MEHPNHDVEYAARDSEETKIDARQADHVSRKAPAGREPPTYVKNLSADERKRAERALVRKIDFRLIPPIVIMYILNYLDRNNIASARLAGLEDELKLHGSQYNTAGKRKYDLQSSVSDLALQ